eukprot:scaffold18817_cov97-Skeletonema_dohrnii-CCMP3373.AAC.2
MDWWILLLPAAEEDATNDFHIMPFHGRGCRRPKETSGMERTNPKTLVPDPIWVTPIWLTPTPITAHCLSKEH